MKRKNSTINISKIISIVLVFSFFAIIIKLSFVSLSKETDGVDLTAFVEARNTEEEILPAKRGNIYTIDGEILAQNVNSFTVVAYLSPSRTKDEKNPQHVVNKEQTASLLAPILNMTEENILNLLNRNVYQVELGPGGRDISSVTKKQIEALALPGIGFIETSKRYYPLSTFAPYVVGFAARDPDDASAPITGKMGIEAYYDEELQGINGKKIYQKDAYGYTMPIQNNNVITEPAKNGQDIYLTIDSNIQLFVENGIKEFSSTHQMDWLTMAVMDAKTGAILASGSNPSFNLNKLDIKEYLNPLTSYQYEPGSTMKIFSFLAAMENDAYDGNAKYQSGIRYVDDARIQDYNGHGWGVITYDEGFSYSSNTAATDLALKIGREKLYNFYDSLGFGKTTGITLPSEADGSIDFTYRTELATASFGQGITTTPIQNLQALTILVNDGVELQPYIVEKIVDSDTKEVTYQHERTELGQKASKEHTDKMLSMMYDVVWNGKTDARYYRSDNIVIAGKTGTAQFTGADGKYKTGTYDYIRSFAGIFPYENPQYIIYVSVKRYTGSIKEYANMITKIVEEIAKYKNISKSIEKVDSSKIITMDKYISSETTITEEKLKKLNLNVIKLGNGKFIINQYPTYGSTILVGNKVFLITNDSEYKMPDIKGWSSSEVITLCKLLNIKYELTGYGNVIESSIKPDTTITNDLVLKVKLN